MNSNVGIERRKSLSSGPLARYERLLEIRSVENTIQDLFAEGLVHGTTHTCQGQEAVSVALAATLGTTEVVTCTYRCHGTALALGIPPEEVFSEVLGRQGGSVGGVGGSMHLVSKPLGLMPTFAIVGAGLPVAVGAAAAARSSGTDDISVAICGDGATNIGAFHEALNLASVWKLPVLFIIENNLYGEYSPIWATTPIEDLHLRGTAYDIPAESADGQDVEELLGVLHRCVQAVKRDGPLLLEVKTYRFAGHSRSDSAPYRPEGELEAWLQRDPLAIARQNLALAESEAQLTQTEDRVRSQVDESLAAAKASPFPTASSMFRNVW